ncbi:hypothetical protein FA95DRAFT_1357329 [Auriscalpium vulgare]|uniref:Uncharacterized protein n=1 Tax=Auriscalpium vulgare TaxID=40419 RepID=A0ACB8R170_9AGAM|nr:hypothetical protein FA95DRAFT_1357329 [Auriscalpium vulgare]
MLIVCAPVSPCASHVSPEVDSSSKTRHRDCVPWLPQALSTRKGRAEWMALCRGREMDAAREQAPFQSVLLVCPASTRSDHSRHSEQMTRRRANILLTSHADSQLRRPHIRHLRPGRPMRLKKVLVLPQGSVAF